MRNPRGKQRGRKRAERRYESDEQHPRRHETGAGARMKRPHCQQKDGNKDQRIEVPTQPESLRRGCGSAIGRHGWSFHA